MRSKVACLFLLLALVAMSFADNDCQITNSTPVAGLSYDSANNLTSSMTFGWQHSYYVVGANWLSINVSGCGATATSDPFTWKFNTTGTVTVTMTWTAWRMPAPYGPPGAYTATDTRTYYVIGGPVQLTDHERVQRREGRTGVVGTQPVILDYFGTGEQAPRRATFSAVLSQPGVTYQWSKSGPMAIDGSSTGTSAKFYATGGSGRAGASPSLAFTKVYDGVSYTVYDCTQSAEKVCSCHAPSDCRFYSADTTPVTGGSKYLLYVVSNIGDPLREVKFQERYPDTWTITYTDGTPTESGSGVPAGLETNANGSPFYSGNVDSGQAHPGYSYMAKDQDTNALTSLVTLPDFTMTLYQSIYGGTSVTTGTTGILIGVFEIKLTCTSNVVTASRTKIH